MKKFILRLLFWIGILFLFFISYFVYVYYDAVAVSKGKPIPTYENPKTALLVIDIQEGITGDYSNDETYKEQSSELIQKVNEVITMAYEADIPIVYIRQETQNWLLNWADDYALAAGVPGVAIDRRLKVVSLNHFPKRKSDAFSNHELDHFLRTLEVNRLLITGLDIAFCAGRTSQAALNRGYEVFVVEDAVISESDELKVENIEKLDQAGATIIQTNQVSEIVNQ